MIDDLTPNFWKGRTRTDCLVLHYTANESLSEAVSLMRARGVSAHYIVGTDGEVRRLVHEKHRAWPAGDSAWNGRVAVNQFSIGIETVNFGWAILHANVRTDGKVHIPPRRTNGKRIS